MLGQVKGSKGQTNGACPYDRDGESFSRWSLAYFRLINIEYQEIGTGVPLTANIVSPQWSLDPGSAFEIQI